MYLSFNIPAFHLYLNPMEFQLRAYWKDTCPQFRFIGLCEETCNN